MSNLLDTFTVAYLECLFFVSHNDTDGEPLEESISDLAPEAMQKVKDDCEKFQEENAFTLRAVYGREYDGSARYGTYESAQAGHDFALTRNHHGAGFWDRGLGKVGDRLTKAAHGFGESNLYVGDGGPVYVDN